MFLVYTDPSPCMSKIFVSDVRVQACRRYMLRFPRTRTSEFVRGCAMHMLKATCSHGRYCRVPKMAMATDPIMHSSLGCSVNTILSGAWTRTRARMLGQCKGKCALICLLVTYLATCCHSSGRHGRQHEHKQINIMKVHAVEFRQMSQKIHSLPVNIVIGDCVYFGNCNGYLKKKHGLDLILRSVILANSYQGKLRNQHKQFNP